MKKRIMLLAAAALVGFSAPVFADVDRPIEVSQLPASAQKFLADHFAGVEVSFAKVDAGLFDKDYKVIFVDGSKVEFDKNGAWTDVDCKFSQVPAGIVPQPIANYLAEHRPDRTVRSIDRDRRDYEVKLDNGLELKFDLQFRLIDIDD